MTEKGGDIGRGSKREISFNFPSTLREGIEGRGEINTISRKGIRADTGG